MKEFLVKYSFAQITDLRVPQLSLNTGRKQSWASTSTYSYSSTVLVVLVLILVLEGPVLVLYSYSRGVYSSIRLKNIIIHADTSVIVAVALSLLVLPQSLKHAVLSEPDDFLREKSGQPNLLFFKKAYISFSL